MEVEKPPLAPEPPTLLKTYKWRTAAPMGDREPERGMGSPGSRRWTRLQGWKRSYSQPESDGPDDGAGKGSLGAPKASTRRSLFQRAFSAPSKGTKETRAPEGGKATLQKYLRSMSKRKGHVESGYRAEHTQSPPTPCSAPPVSTHRTSSIPLAPAPDVPVWDVSNFSLVDGHLVLVGRDEEALCRSRNRTGSSTSHSTNLHAAGARRDPDPAADERNTRGAGKSTESENSSTSQFSNVKDNCERLELALSLWVYEARDLPPRRRLRCHLHLDGTLFARTTAKVASPDGELFWGELFQLAALPPAHALTLALCRDDHPGQPMASITVPLAELAASRQPLERWYPLSGPGGGERVPSVRVRGRYREVRVLPIVRYKELAEFITFHYRELCAHLEPTIAVRHKEELAGALVRVLQSTGKAKSFLIDLGVAELDRFDDREALIFRENHWPPKPSTST
nr:PREDICTED: LOW QUALITY PROTEIN: RAS protein activator like-3-like [Opisthocomus hoazin]